MSEQEVQTPTPERERNLEEIAGRIKETEFFDGQGRHMGMKQQLFLVAAGEKPLADLSTGRMVDVEGGRVSVPDDPQAVTGFVESLGLVCHTGVSEHDTQVIVAKNPHLIDRYGKATDAYDAGLALGYPQSAVDAYVTGECLPNAEQDKLEAEAGIGDFGFFRLSKAHWQEELAVVKRWHDVVERYGLL